MEKYSRLSKITTDFLQGTLNRLNVSYSDDSSLILTFIYEDHNHYWFDYELGFNINSKSISFAHHMSEGNLNKIELNREYDFESAVFDELFKSKMTDPHPNAS